MDRELKYWKWKSTIIDFDNISDEKDKFNSLIKKDEVFQYLGTPDKDIHQWYSGGFSCEYNRALDYAKDLGLIEDYIDYDTKCCELEEEIEELKKINEQHKELNGELRKENEELRLKLSEYEEAIINDTKWFGLQGRINAAITYIDNNIPHETGYVGDNMGYSYGLDEKDVDYLYRILKGK
jgi:hypothetical protein